MSNITLDHVHIYSAEVERTVEFYKRIFGAVEIRRIENQPTLIVHLDLRGVRLVISQCTETNAKGIGHFAIAVDELAETLDGLRSARLAVSNTRQVNQFQNAFIKDPNGIDIEIISPSTK